MRDYKNVKVPARRRAPSNRAFGKRLNVGTGGLRPGKPSGVSARALLRVLVFILLVAAGMIVWQAYHFILHAGVFQIAGVDVQGVQNLSEGEIKAIAGVFTGQNIFRVDLEKAAERARLNPWVKEVRIRRTLPNRITMAFTERTPTAILDTGRNRFLMDSDAVVISCLTSEGTSSWSLPTVSVRDRGIKPGDSAASEGVVEAMALLGEIAARGGWKLSDVTVRANSPETLTAVYNDHEFRIGSGNYGEKLRRLAEVMNDVQQRGLTIAYVDLRPARQAAVMVLKNKK